ncbi:S9 family peptidase [Halovivax gelatinilyticus]|uniref:S9 family peptidase n=1 Tax=Halovivax gelatinilyticus TaxID=2961597 RepID=UPI0020CA30CA|nr:prolyl oligopeptidase family serine peptidase [Halovivax gelatinilyticus]
MAVSFTVEDALGLRYVHEHAWNAKGSAVGYLRFDGGETDLVVRRTDTDRPAPDEPPDSDPDALTDLGTVTGFDWRPDRPTDLALVADGAIERFNTKTGDRRTLVDADDAYASITWAPDGDRLAAVSDGSIWLFDEREGSSRTLARDSSLSVASLFAATPLEWSPDGRYLATVVEAPADGLGLAVVDVAGDEVAWTYRPDPTDGRLATTFDWVGPETLVYVAETVDGTHRAYRAVTLGEGRRSGTDENGTGNDGTTLLSESDGRGLPRDPIVGADDGRFAVLSARTGYHHVYAIDVDARRAAVESLSDRDDPGFDGPGVCQVTSGEFEARGDALDEPAWSPDGERLAFVTNERDPGERDLVVCTIGDLSSNDAVTDRRVVDDEPGNVLYPTWSPDGERLAVIRAGRTTSADVHVVDASGRSDDPRLHRLSRAHTDPAVFEAFPEPEPVSIPRDLGAPVGDERSTVDDSQGETVPGYLYLPPDAEPGDDRPAVVWCHGGPMRQMRRGFHHMRSYAAFHAFNYVLVSKGYAVLSINYRGGIGYGRDFENGIVESIGETDVDDCVAAAAFCRDHPVVGDRVGLWGLSYGGYLACALATTSDAYDCTVNFAGVWDWADWVRFATERHWGAGRGFVARFGGHPDEIERDDALAERYRIASPASSVDELDTPLFSLHGTADPNVPFDQLDAIVADCVESGRAHEVMYYPDENHMFEGDATWRDALGRVLPFLDEHLRGDSLRDDREGGT